MMEICTGHLDNATLKPSSAWTIYDGLLPDASFTLVLGLGLCCQQNVPFNVLPRVAAYLFMEWRYG